MTAAFVQQMDATLTAMVSDDLRLCSAVNHLQWLNTFILIYSKTDLFTFFSQPAILILCMDKCF